MPNVPAISLPSGGAFGYVVTNDPQQDSQTHTLIGGGGGGGANVLDTYLVQSTGGPNNNPNDIAISTVNGYGTLAARPGSAFEGYIYYASDTQQFYRWTSGIWTAMSPLDATKLAIANNLSDLSNVATARTNLGLGAAALLADPITIAHGGTGLTTIGAAGLGLTSDDGTVAVWGHLQYDGQNTALSPSDGIADTTMRSSISSGSVLTITSGTLYVAPLWIPKGLLLTSVRWCKGGTAVASVNHQIFGLYDNNRNLLRGTSDDGATAWNTNAIKTLNLTSTFTTTYTGLYYLGLLIQGTTPGTMASGGNLAGVLALGTVNSGNTSATGLTALPASFATITGGSVAYGGVL